MGGGNHQLGQRERDILTTIIDQYISTGEPVGSRTLARLISEGLSPATVRNVMADLADSGFLEQPHTSAGRVPTAQAFRYYVQQLGQDRALGEADQNRIRSSIGDPKDTEQFLERSSHVLSQLSRSVGVAMAASVATEALEHVHFTRLAENKVLAVVVTRGGVVSDRVLRVKRDLLQNDLDVAARYINENFRGWTLGAVRTELQHRIEQERSEYDRLMRSLDQLCRDGALADSPREQAIFIEGTANLVANAPDAQRLRQILETLEAKEGLAELLTAYLSNDGPEVRVVIGLENAGPHLQNFVLIGAPARIGEELMGGLAVLGPTRIDYEHMIPAVQ
ncbi:MAG TPA: heat-inducible transcriptional repressor HrcA, partial [Terriglobales bacterium]|nr:heat-inducible transcriptional repressor HrcA [Terriglobales bacterium]